MTLRRDQKKKIKKMLVLHSISFSHVTTKKSIQIYFFIINLTHLTNHTISIKYKIYYLWSQLNINSNQHITPYYIH